MVLGRGRDSTSQPNTMELISLNPKKSPLPDCLKKTFKFPQPGRLIAGATIST